MKDGRDGFKPPAIIPGDFSVCFTSTRFILYMLSCSKVWPDEYGAWPAGKHNEYKQFKIKAQP